MCLVWEQIKFSTAKGLQIWCASWREASRTWDLTGVFDRAISHHLLHSASAGTWFRWPAMFKTPLHNGKSLRKKREFTEPTYFFGMEYWDRTYCTCLLTLKRNCKTKCQQTPIRTRFEPPPSLSHSNYILEVHSRALNLLMLYRCLFHNATFNLRYSCAEWRIRPQSDHRIFTHL